MVGRRAAWLLALLGVAAAALAGAEPTRGGAVGHAGAAACLRKRRGDADLQLQCLAPVNATLRGCPHRAPYPRRPRRRRRRAIVALSRRGGKWEAGAEGAVPPVPPALLAFDARVPAHGSAAAAQPRLLPARAAAPAGASVPRIVGLWFFWCLECTLRKGQAICAPWPHGAAGCTGPHRAGSFSGALSILAESPTTARGPYFQPKSRRRSGVANGAQRRAGRRPCSRFPSEQMAATTRPPTRWRRPTPRRSALS